MQDLRLTPSKPDKVLPVVVVSAAAIELIRSRFWSLCVETDQRASRRTDGFIRTSRRSLAWLAWVACIRSSLEISRDFPRFGFAPMNGKPKMRMARVGREREISHPTETHDALTANQTFGAPK